MQAIILASSSPYRRELLRRLKIPFDCVKPEVDESPLPGEAPPVVAARLAKAKAEAVASDVNGAIVIGSDQTLESGGRLLGKPGDAGSLRDGLRFLSGRKFALHTAVHLISSSDGKETAATHTYTGVMGKITERQIERYSMKEPAIDCAGGMKVEGLGICLLESLAGDDPTGIIGLPLTFVARSLREFGVKILG